MECVRYIFRFRRVLISSAYWASDTIWVILAFYSYFQSKRCREHGQRGYIESGYGKLMFQRLSCRFWTVNHLNWICIDGTSLALPELFQHVNNSIYIILAVLYCWPGPNWEGKWFDFCILTYSIWDIGTSRVSLNLLSQAYSTLIYTKSLFLFISLENVTVFVPSILLTEIFLKFLLFSPHPSPLSDASNSTYEGSEQPVPLDSLESWREGFC